jgi:hypothetical protein
VLLGLAGALACGERFVQAEDSSGGRNQAALGGTVDTGSGGRGNTPTGGLVMPGLGGGVPSGGVLQSSGTGGSSDGGSLVGTGGLEQLGETGGSGSGGFGGGEVMTSFADDFEDGDLEGWTYNPSFSVKYGELKCEECAAPIVSVVRMGVPFAASVELSTIPEFGSEMNLVVLSQSGSSCDMLEVSYSPEKRAIRLFGCWNERWTETESLSQMFTSGQRLGVRIENLPEVEIWVDDTLVGQLSIEGFPFEEGSIGVNALGYEGFGFDDIRGASL